MIEWFMQCAMFWPLAGYLFAVGVLNIARRPVMIPGTTDTTGLCCGLSGLLVVGPMALVLRPILHHGDVYPLLVGGVIYFLLAALIVGFQRRRLVFYNCSIEQFEQIWCRAVAAADPEARSLGSLHVLPSCGVSLRVEAFGWLRNVSVAAEPGKQSSAGWKTLERCLLASVSECQPRPRSLRAPLVLWAICSVLIFTPVGWLLTDRDMAGKLQEFLRQFG